MVEVNDLVGPQRQSWCWSWVPQSLTEVYLAATRPGQTEHPGKRDRELELQMRLKLAGAKQLAIWEVSLEPK